MVSSENIDIWQSCEPIFGYTFLLAEINELWAEELWPKGEESWADELWAYIYEFIIYQLVMKNLILSFRTNLPILIFWA